MDTLQVHRVSVRFGVVSMNGSLCENERVIYIVVQIAWPGDTVHVSHTYFKVYYAIRTSDILSHLDFFFSTHSINILNKPFPFRLKNINARIICKRIGFVNKFFLSNRSICGGFLRNSSLVSFPHPISVLSSVLKLLP